ncbi:PhzF family phenazine biosynthesis protein [Vibrio pectenicida]|uniref:PhzF family phenazine biosynthesis protein n=1 Tax=Vibrio pectenicida TaxID=62763 RepID=A0A3R9DTD1_9VIBR|nr:PhzF family phenazine biosynthesis protein [Vibrio pectenicida]RSD26933.1 PhzF family phenazine biosynthesis protein [Vibrio pectenicida]
MICDLFVSKSAAGNPCGVFELEQWLNEDELVKITRNLNQPITAFVVNTLGDYNIRWFALAGEINLCGHGSLAAGAVMLNRYMLTEITFNSVYGRVTISKQGSPYSLILPSWTANSPPNYEEATEPFSMAIDVFSTRDLVVVLPSVKSVIDYSPDLEEIAKMDNYHALIVTSQNGESGYVLRYFAPSIGIDEDIATGSAQCSLAPYWFAKLGRDNLFVNQLSHAGGYFEVERMSDEYIKVFAQVSFR